MRKYDAMGSMVCGLRLSQNQGNIFFVFLTFVISYICLGNAEVLLEDDPSFPTAPERQDSFLIKQGTKRVQNVGVRKSDYRGQTRRRLWAENGVITGMIINGKVQTFTTACHKQRKYKQRCLKRTVYVCTILKSVAEQCKTRNNHRTLIMERVQAEMIKTVITKITL